MTETVDQAQAQPPRALAGIIEDATSLSFVPASHFEGSRGGRLTSRLTTPYSGKAVTSGSATPYTTSVDVNLPTHHGHLQQFAGTQDEPALPRAVIRYWQQPELRGGASARTLWCRQPSESVDGYRLRRHCAFHLRGPASPVRPVIPLTEVVRWPMISGAGGPGTLSAR